jgi:hypothetical protein
MKQIVIMPGGFHPFHAGHAALYQSAIKAFPNAEVYVAATNDTKTRPFPFAIKEKLAKLAGVAQGHFIQVKSPFKSEEITSHYNPNEDVLIFVRSEKDKTEQPKPGGTKKDGNPAYFQPWTGKNLQPFSKHAYIAYLPTVEFGPGIKSATEIRNAWPNLDDRRKTAMVMSLYPVTQKNPKLAANVVKMLDMGMGGQEGVAEDATGSFDYDQLSAMPMKDRLALYKTNPELKNLYNTEFQRRIDATLNNYAWMTPQEKDEYERLATLDVGKNMDTRSYAKEKYLKQLFQQKMDAKKAASMIKVHWAPLTQLESFLQGKVNNKIELSAYLVPNVESLGQVRWGSENSVGIVLDGHITIGGRGDLGSDQYKMTAGQRGQQKYVSRPGQIDPTLSMDTSTHHEVLVDNWKIKEIVLPADIPPEVDRLIQQYKIPVRRLGNPKSVAEGSQDDPEDYRAHLLKTLPRMMNFLSKNVKGWSPSKEQYLAAIETGYQVMKHTGDVQQAGKAMSDELNTLHKMSQGQQGVAEGAPIVVAQAPIDVRNPKKAPQPYRNQGDIVPPTKPPSTEKRGVKGRPGQRPMPTYESANLSVEQLAHISDKALDDAYHYGRSTPGANFGWMANLQSAKAAKKLIDAGETDIEAISDAIHKGWNITAAADYKGQLQLDTPTPEDKKLKRAKLAMQSYSQLPEEEKEKDRVVARAMLAALGKTNVSESADYLEEK